LTRQILKTKIFLNNFLIYDSDIECLFGQLNECSNEVASPSRSARSPLIAKLILSLEIEVLIVRLVCIRSFINSNLTRSDLCSGKLDPDLLYTLEQ